MIHEMLPSTESATEYPRLLIGGPAHGRFYLGKDQPYTVEVPICDEMERTYRAHNDDRYTMHVRAERYERASARVSGWQTDWIYYRHHSLDEAEGMFKLWDFLWEAAGRLARAGGWEKDKRCEACRGTGMER